MNSVSIFRIVSSLGFAAIALCCSWFPPLLAAQNATQNPAQPSTPSSPRRPNIVMIFTDDHALQAIGAYGSRINQTPHIDRLASQGAIFLNSFCANSICGPSRACILTGKHSHQNGFLRNENRFNPQQMTFPALLQQSGYQTALVGKWHLGTTPVGFDYWEILPGQGSYYNPDFIQMDGSQRRYEGYCTDLITDLSLQWLKERRSTDQPFLLMCQHKAPHRNWSPAPRHFQLYQSAPVPLPATFADDYGGRTSLLAESEMSIRNHFHWQHDMKFHGTNLFPQHFRDDVKNDEYERMNAEQRAAWDAHYEPLNQQFIQQVQQGKLTDREIWEWKYQRYITDYLKCIAAVDESVGKLNQFLDDQQLADNTIVIYASDQGFYLGEHGWYDKRWMFEESLKMPFIVRWPGKIKPGIRSEAMVQNIDYAPTFLAAAGLPVPAEIQGQSLLPVFAADGKAPRGWRDAIYYAYYENAAVHEVPIHDGVRSSRYKLMFFPRSLEWQLFDLQSDPQELASRHADPAYGEILRAMQQRYRDLKKLYEVNSAVIPATRGDESWWRERHQQVTRQAQKQPHRIAFIGDSITQGWESTGNNIWQEHFADRAAINLGFSGDRTEHVIWRLQNGNLASAGWEQVVIMIGTNNTGHLMQDPAEVAAGVREIVSLTAAKAPQAQIHLLAIFPRGGSPHDPGRLNNQAINDRLARLQDGQRVHFHDLGAAFLESDGTISPEVMPDQLHLSEEGYRRWAQELLPILAP